MRGLNQRTDELARRLERTRPQRRLELGSQRLNGLRRRLASASQRRLEHERQRIRGADHRLRQQSPRLRLERTQTTLGQLKRRSLLAMQHHLQTAQQRLANRVRGLNAASPLNLMERGYSITTDNKGQAITKVDQLTVGQSVVTRLYRGKVHSTVTKTEDDSS